MHLVVHLLEPLLISVIIVIEKLDLIIVLEGDQSFLENGETDHVDSVQVRLINSCRKRL